MPVAAIPKIDKLENTVFYEKKSSLFLVVEFRVQDAWYAKAMT